MISYKLLCGNNSEVLYSMEENSVDACITDPPYGMEIANVGWDHNVPPKETWEAVMRVLKPGAFLLSFSDPAHYHRMAIAVEDAGFVPKDMINWIITTKMAKVNRLKPAHEPIFVAQKPLDGSIKNNVEKWGCGAIDIDRNRIPWDKVPPKGWIKGGGKRRAFGGDVAKASDLAVKEFSDADPRGRYPSNVIGLLDDEEYQKYFYAPRVSRKERGEYNDHPTPKPIDLMRYLCSVFCPVGGTLIDPFVGSGSTILGAVLANKSSIGIDQNQHYIDIAQRRIDDSLQNSLDKFFE